MYLFKLLWWIFEHDDPLVEEPSYLAAFDLHVLLFHSLCLGQMLEIVKFPTTFDTQEGNSNNKLTLRFFRLSLDGFLRRQLELSGCVDWNEVKGGDWPEFLLIC